MSKSKHAPKFSRGLTIVLSIVCLLVGAIVGFGGAFVYDKATNPIFNSDVYSSGEVSFHFLELGNNNTGDSIYIKSGETDILIDGGSRTNSSSKIKQYIDNYVTDGVLEYVIVTHADQDHIASFAGDNSNTSLFDMYEVETIIDFPKSDKNTAVLNRYYQKRDAEVENGAKHYTALECWNETNGAKRSYELSKDVTLNILYNYYYENHSSDENNYSVCFQIEQGDNKFLFTGDLEEKGEEYLVEYNNLSPVKLFKAGHHGSPTSSNDVLLDVIKPEMVVITCVAGSVEYTDNLANTFPSQAVINRISKWTQKVYVTSLGYIREKGVKENGTIDYEDIGFESMNGNIVVSCVKGNISVNCSNNNTLLKDTEWFHEYRTTPSYWS